MNERGNIDERINRCFTSLTDEIDYSRFYSRSSIVARPLFRACHISRCLTTARRHSAIFLARARMTPSFNAHAKRSDRLAKNVGMGSEFPMDCAPNYMSMGHSFHYSSGHC